jgi:nitroreductase
MELYEAMRTTFAAREFTNDPLPDATLYRILDNARFAPSGGNRQGERVIIVREMATRQALVELSTPGAQRYMAQRMAGENPWNTIVPSDVSAATIAQTLVPSSFTDPLLKAAVVLVVCVDLSVVASTDAHLDRVGIISGASIYPFVWNILLAARSEGFGGTITTMAIAQEPRLKALLDIPENCAVCAVIPLGKPVKQLTRLKRHDVAAIAVREKWGGAAFTSQ